MGRSTRFLIQNIGERADAVDHLLRAPLTIPSRPAYKRYVSDVYALVVTIEAATASYSQLLQRRQHATWLADELANLGATVEERDELAASSSSVVAGLPSHQVEALGWLFVVERLVFPVPVLRRRVERRMPRGEAPLAASSSANLPELRSGITEFSRALDRTIDDDRELARLSKAALTALDACEEWAVAATARVDPVRVRFA